MKQPVKAGTLSILLGIIVLCVMTLTVLSLSTAAAEDRLAVRYAESTNALYALEAQGQTWLAQFDADLTAGKITQETTEHTIGDPATDARYISICLRADLAAKTYIIDAWRVIAPLHTQAGMDNLWKGEKTD